MIYEPLHPIGLCIMEAYHRVEARRGAGLYRDFHDLLARHLGVAIHCGDLAAWFDAMNRCGSVGPADDLALCDAMLLVERVLEAGPLAVDDEEDEPC